MILRRTLAAGLALPALAQTRSAAGAIDTHVHFYDPARPQSVPWPPKSEALLYRTTLPLDFERATQGLDIAGTVVVEASPWLEDNQWILDLAQDNPVIRGFVGHLDVADPGYARNLARFARNPLFRGIRLGGGSLTSVLAGKDTFANLERLAGGGLSLDVVGDSSMLKAVAALAHRIPHLRIIIDHLPFNSDAQEALKPLHGQPNVFAKVSNVPRMVNGAVEENPAYYRPVLDQLWNVFGPDRLIYGSNWPVSGRIAPYPVAWRLVKSYFESRGAAAASGYFRGNARTAYRWVDR